MTDETRPLNAGSLAAIKARLANLSPGPWSILEEHPSALVDGNGDWLITGDGQGFGLVCSDFDAAFIAAARTDIPRLLAAVEAMRAIVETVAGYAWETVECSPDVDHAVPCPWCRRSIWHVSHAPDCLVVKAQPFLKR